MSIGFVRSRDRKQRELTNIKTQKGIFHLSNCLGDSFGFAEHQETGTFGLGYNLKMTRNTDNAVLNKGNEINKAKIKIVAIEWSVPHYTPNLTQQKLLMNQIIKKIGYLQSFNL